MPETDSLVQIQDSVTAGVGNLSRILNFAPGPTALAGFVAEGIFKAIRLGVEIRKAAAKASADLKNRILAQSVLRNPIAVDLTPLEFRSFFRNPNNFAAFPGFEQFEPEIREFRETGGSPSLATRRILKVARHVVPALQIDPELSEHPELSKIFVMSMDPLNDRSTRDLVLSYIQLFPEEAMTLDQHSERLGSYWKDQLTISINEITRAQLEAQANLDQAVRTLVQNAIFDTQTGALTKSLELTKTLKKASIDKQIEALNRKIQEAATKAEKDLLQDKIAKLNAHKTKIDKQG